MDDDWKDWIVILRVQAQNSHPPNEWDWGTALCSADATDADLLAALPEEEVSRILRRPKK